MVLQYAHTDIRPTARYASAGSGTTGVAAQNLGFYFIGCELSPEYFEICKKRMSYEEEISFEDWLS